MNVARLLTFLTGGDVERNFFAFLQGFETIALNRGKVSEEVFTTFDPAAGDIEPGDEERPATVHGSTVSNGPFSKDTPWGGKPYQLPLARRARYWAMRKAAGRIMKAPSPTRRVEEAETLILAALARADPTLMVIAEEEAWEEFFRTSDLEGEDAVGYSSGLLPPKGIRVGCICMDGTRKDDRGRGACGGFGGVRFWLYQINEDSVAMYPTSRHRIHPEPLSEMETNNLSSRNAFAAEPPAKRRSWYDYRLEDVLIAMMVCITIGYVAKMWFRHD